MESSLMGCVSLTGHRGRGALTSSQFLTSLLGSTASCYQTRFNTSRLIMASVYMCQSMLLVLVVVLVTPDLRLETLEIVSLWKQLNSNLFLKMRSSN